MSFNELENVPRNVPLGMTSAFKGGGKMGKKTTDRTLIVEHTLSKG